MSLLSAESLRNILAKWRVHVVGAKVDALHLRCSSTAHLAILNLASGRSDTLLRLVLGSWQTVHVHSAQRRYTSEQLVALWITGASQRGIMYMFHMWRQSLQNGKQCRAAMHWISCLDLRFLQCTLIAWGTAARQENESLRCRNLLECACGTGAMILAKKIRDDQVRRCFVTWCMAILAHRKVRRRVLNAVATVLQASLQSQATLMACLVLSRWFQWTQEHSALSPAQPLEAVALLQRAVFCIWRALRPQRQRDEVATQLQAKVDGLYRELAVARSGQARRKSHALAIVEGSMNGAFLGRSLHQVTLPPAADAGA